MLQEGRNAIVVDPEDAAPPFEAPAHGNLQLAAILVTHHRPDHTLANLRFAQRVEPGRTDPTHSTARCEALRRISAARRHWKKNIR